MTDLRFRIYPAATPLTGLLVTLDSQDVELGSGLRVELNGSGSGRIIIHSDHPDVTAANFARGNYVLVHDLDLGEDIGGFWLTEGEFRAVSKSEEGGRILTFGGPGSLHYLSRAVWWNAPYIQSTVYNGPRDDGLWHWPSNKLGAIFKRFVDEAQDGDRPGDPIPDLTYDFGATLDSAGDPWESMTGDFTFPIGYSGIESVAEFMRGGLTIWTRPNLLTQAYQQEVGTDRSSGTFTAGKVRFEKGVNIAADLSHAIHESPRVKRLLVKGESSVPSTFNTIVDAGAPIDREGFLNYGRTDDDAALTLAGETDVALRAAETTTAKFPHIPGDDEANGLYTPGWPGGSGHYWLGDTVTLHTGADAYDFNEVELRVAAITWEMRAAGDWSIDVELGATYYSISEPNIAGVTAPGTSQSCGCCPTGPSGPYGDGATVDVLWDFASGIADGQPHENLDTTATYGWTGKWNAGGYAYSTVIWGGMGMPADDFLPVTALTDYTFEADVGQGSNPTYHHAETVIHAIWYNSSFVNIGEVDVCSSEPPESGFGHVSETVQSPSGAAYVRITYEFNVSRIDNVMISHGAGGQFAGDAMVGSDDLVGSIGTPGCEFSYFDHKHPAQTAAVTPIDDDGGFYPGQLNVEAALQLAGQRDFRNLIHGGLISAMHTNDDESAHLFYTEDRTTLHLMAPAVVSGMRDPSIMHWRGKYWIAGTRNATPFNQFQIWSADDLFGTWTEVDATIGITGIGTTYFAWAPEWFIDDDGSVYLIIAVTTTNSVDGPFRLYLLTPTDDTLATWGDAVEITGTGLPSDMIDGFVVQHDGYYWLFYKENNGAFIELAQSTSLGSGYTVVGSGDWANWKVTDSIEAPSVVPLDDGRWGIYFVENDGFGSFGSYYSESESGDLDGTWSAREQLTVDVGGVLSHGTFIRLPSVIDHDRDLRAHRMAAWLDTGEHAAIDHTGIPGVGGGSLTVEDVDGTPSATNVDEIHMPNGSVTDEGGGVATIAAWTRELLISDTPSTPLVFADLVQNEAEDDLVYADTPSY